VNQIANEAIKIGNKKLLRRY